MCVLDACAGLGEGARGCGDRSAEPGAVAGAGADALTARHCPAQASRELPDLQLIKRAYHSVDSFTRKQVWLPKELGPELWSKFHDELQYRVVEGAVPREATLNGMFGDDVPML
eukprot:48418-Prymnesium_polylepis.1